MSFGCRWEGPHVDSPGAPTGHRRANSTRVAVWLSEREGVRRYGVCCKADGREV